MSRNKAERRANDLRHQRRNLRLNVCSATVTPSGERCSCSLCETEKRNLRGRWELRPARSNTVRYYE